jgi:hypothetical protein
MNSLEMAADAAWDWWLVKFLIFYYSNSNQKQMITNKIAAMAEYSNNSNTIRKDGK